MNHLIFKVFDKFIKLCESYSMNFNFKHYDKDLIIFFFYFPLIIIRSEFISALYLITLRNQLNYLICYSDFISYFIGHLLTVINCADYYFCLNFRF